MQQALELKAVEATSAATNTTATLQAHYKKLAGAVDQALAARLPAEGEEPERLSNSLRYILLTPGKRVRALLVLLTGQCLGAQYRSLIDSACGLEMIHAASLVLDDLPAMDNADWRRGKPSCHRVFGEDTTILSAIALLAEAYAVISRSSEIGDDHKVVLSRYWSDAVGLPGLSGGQERDLHPPQATASLAAIETTHQLKTGALFGAATASGALLGRLPAKGVEDLHRCGILLGVAFQIFDDVLDLRGELPTAGKEPGQDVGKHTIVSVLQPDQALQRAQAYIAEAETLLRTHITDPAPMIHYLEGISQQFTRKLARGV